MEQGDTYMNFIKRDTINILRNIKFYMLILSTFVCFFSSVLYGQELNNNKEQRLKSSDNVFKKETSIDNTQDIQNKNQLKAKVYLNDNDRVRVDKSLPILPIEVGVSNGIAYSVKIDLLKIVSRGNNIIPIKFNIEPSISDILPNQIGKVFYVKFDTAEIDNIEPGKYTAYLSITSENADPQIKKYSFEILSSGEFLNLTKFLKRFRDNFIGVTWNVLEIIFITFFIGLIIWFFRLSFKKRHSLNVLPVVNDTGMTGEIEGVASGIDDLLMSKLQDIAQKSRISEIKHYGLSSPLDEKRERKEELPPRAGLLNVVGWGNPMDLQKLGDISIGPVKIPLGAITAFLTKIFGGNYVSGAIQKYGTVNKIVLRLEKRPHILKHKLDIGYFEVTWPSEMVKIENISEGVPKVIEELAYRITLDIDEEIGTKDWNAYKYFLEGILAFRDFEENKTRKDRLIDAINFWRGSVRLDPNFAKAHNNLGVALAIEGKYVDAIFRYQKVIQMSPELVGAEAHYNLASLYWIIYKDETKTLDQLRKAKALDPDLSDIYNLRGLVYSNRFEYKQEVNMYEQAIRRSKGVPKPDFYYNLSVAKYYLEDYYAAQKAGEKAIDIYGHKEKETALLLTMGMIHIKKGEFKKALNYLEEGLIKEPENLDLLDGYGVALREYGDLDKALLIQRRFLRLWPEDAIGYAEIAKTLRRLEAPEDEAIIYEKIGSALSDTQIRKALARHNMDHFQEQFGIAINQNNESLLQQKIFTGVMGCISYYYFKKYTEGVNFFEKIFQHELKDIRYLLEAETLHTYGITLKKRAEQSEQARQSDLSESDYELAVERLEEAISLYQEEQLYDLAQCYCDLAEAYEKISLYEKADKAYMRAIDFYKKESLLNHAADTHVKIAECLMKWYWEYGPVDLYELARNECDEAIGLVNSSHEAYHVKGNTYYDLYRYADAIPLYEKALELNYDLPGAQYNLGLCYMQLEKYEQAESKFETTIKLDESYADPYNENKPDPYKQLSICLERLGRLDKAVENLRNAANTFPSSIKYHFLLGQFLVKTNRLDEASKQLKFCLDRDKENTQNLRHLALNSLADLYVEQGADIDKAYKMSRRALIICKPKIKEKQVKDKKVNYQMINEEELSSIRNTLGWIFYQKGQIRKSVAFLEKSLIHALGDPKSHARLAYAYKKFSKTCSDSLIADYLEKARTQWRVVLSLDSQNIWSKIAEEQLNSLAEQLTD